MLIKHDDKKRPEEKPYPFIYIQNTEKCRGKEQHIQRNRPRVSIGRDEIKRKSEQEAKNYPPNIAFFALRGFRSRRYREGIPKSKIPLAKVVKCSKSKKRRTSSPPTTRKETAIKSVNLREKRNCILLPLQYHRKGSFKMKLADFFFG